MKQKRIVITGGSGLIGRHLSAHLRDRGFEVIHLSRRQSGPYETYLWNPEKNEIDVAAFGRCYAVIHLAGESIADGRWTDERKKLILESRVQGTRLITGTINSLKQKPEHVIFTSAIGYYGDRDTETLTEESTPGKGFLAETCIAWEKASSDLHEKIHKTTIRIGMVLAPDGGALPKMTQPVSFFFGAPLGSGEQMVSWIHIDDLISMFSFILEKGICGICNATAPDPVSNADFTKEIGLVLKRPVILPPVPEFVLRMLLGEMADLVCFSSKVLPKKMEASSFPFQFPGLNGALSDILG